MHIRENQINEFSKLFTTFCTNAFVTNALYNILVQIIVKYQRYLLIFVEN